MNKKLIYIFELLNILFMGTVNVNIEMLKSSEVKM